MLFADVLGSGQGLIREPDLDAKVLGLMPFMSGLFPVRDSRPSARDDSAGRATALQADRMFE